MTFSALSKLFSKIKIFAIILIFISVSCSSQSITGPSCVVVNNSYTYTYSGSWSPSTTYFTWTVSGGTITSSKSSGYTVPQITVTWLSAGGGYVNLQTQNPYKTINLNLTIGSALSPGTITTATQNINFAYPPSEIDCSSPSGGSCSSPVYSYLWQSSTDNANWSSTGVFNYFFTSTAALTQTTYFRRMVTENNTGNNAYSNSAKVVVYPLLKAGSVSPASQTINYGTTPLTLQSTGVSGGNNSYTYQWMSSTDNINWNVANGTSNSFTPPTLFQKTYFYVIVSSNGVSVNSSTSVVLVNPQVLPGVISLSYIPINSGGSPGLLTCTPASGGACNGSYTYQWFSSSNNYNYTAILGATGSSYNPGTLTTTNYFRRQVTCGTDVENSNICEVYVGSLVTDLNFIRTREILKAGITDTLTASSLTSAFDVQQVTEYLDGLGRSVQTVNKQASPLQKDMVVPIVYDQYGRTVVNYLPYTSSTNDGNYKSNSLGEQYSFNSGLFPSDQFYYSQVTVESSPLERTLVKYAAGNTWIGSGHGVQTQYMVNDLTDSVRVWNTDSLTGTIPTTSGMYAAGTLYKNVSIDEDGHLVVEYKDISGHIILKKLQLSSNPSTGHSGWHCTYYVYDDIGLLRFVLSPQLMNLINGNWSISASQKAELCFYYGYDSRNRMTVKKIPGAGEVWMAYDMRDRLVMTQDSNLRVGSPVKWMVTEYDSLNRPYRTGLLTDANSLSYHQTNAWNSTSYPNTSANYEILSVTGYDDYSALPASAPSYAIDLTNYNSNNFISSYNISPLNAQQVQQSFGTRGMVTWTQTKVIGSSSTYLYSTHIYDDRGRMIQAKSTNYSGGTDVATTQYDFSGKVLKSHVLHQKAGANPHSYQLLTTNNYDHAGRLLNRGKRTSIDGTLGSTDKIITQNSYNELGQLRKNVLGNNLDSLAYDYNIRGWLTGMNRNYLYDKGSGAYQPARFGFELAYDNLSSAVGISTYWFPYYNGNIGGTIWKSAGDEVRRKYDFTYDTAGRVNQAFYNEDTTVASGGVWQHQTANFGMHGNDASNNYMIKYDANGNMQCLIRHAWTFGNNDKVIDAFLYKYFLNLNKLMQVWDDVNDSTTRLGDFHFNPSTKTSVDYGYDGNGNLTQDLNKNIQNGNITYNYLNLPQSIHISGKGTISYTYDAGGNKLQKQTVDSTGIPIKTTTTLYMFGNYVNDTLQFLPQEEGRIRWRADNSSLVYDYFLKDHLGNVRMVLTEDTKIDGYPAAMMELLSQGSDTSFYSNIINTSSTLPSGYPVDNTYSNPNQYAAKVNGSGNKIGPGIALKVMTGDQFNVRVTDWYSSGTSFYTNNNITTELVNAIASAVSPLSAAKASSIQLSSSSNFSSQVGNFVTTETGVTTVPKAYLNWVLFDEQFNFVASSSGWMQVGGHDGSAVTVLSRNGININKNGYLYVYVSNQSQNQDVYFDNLQVTLVHGPLLEETHYYPFGLTMAGISSKALGFGDPGNNKKYNGIEQNNDFNINEYEAFFRNLDPQIGRWWQIDPKTDGYENFSPYASMYDDPIMKSDPLGDEGEDCCLDQIKNWILDKVDHPEHLVLWTETAENNWNYVSSAVTTGAKKVLNNAKLNWETKQDPIHQMMADPMSMITGEGEFKVIEGALESEVKVETNAVKAIDQEAIKRGKESEVRVLSEKNLNKNTKAFKVLDTKTGKTVTTIPDAIENGATIEVKDVKKLSDSKQLRAQSKASALNGKKATVVTGTNTRVSQTVMKRMNIETRNDLGPKN